MPRPDTDELLWASLGRSQALVAFLEGEDLVAVSDALRSFLRDHANARATLTTLIVTSAVGAREGQHAHVEASIDDGAGSTRHVAFELTVLQLEPRPRVLAVGHDVTDWVTGEAELPHRATTDPLTGLTNRTLLTDRIGQAMLAAQREGTSAALIVMDLDGLGNVNDMFGHSMGDALLREIAETTRRQLRESDTLARIGSDEFAILLPPPGDMLGALTTARKIREALARGLPLGISVGQTTVSLGIAVFPQHAQTAQALLEHADAAMRAARRSRRSVAVYETEEDTRERSVLTELEEFGSAIAGGQLDLDYQPTVRLSDGRPMRAEALVRWRHSSRGRLRPAAFVPLAERGGLGPALNAWVLRTALERCKEWRAEGIQAGVTVNVGLHDLLDADLPARIQTDLSATGLEAHGLTLDISEGAFPGDPMRLKRPMLALARIGLRLAVDDFGTGPASLRLLQRLPISEIKLDRRFIGEVCTSIQSWSFVRSGIDAAHDLGLEVTAEGVEDKATAYVLERLGCDVAQGTYFTKSPSALRPGFLRASELDSAPLN